MELQKGYYSTNKTQSLLFLNDTGDRIGHYVVLFYQDIDVRMNNKFCIYFANAYISTRC